MYLNDTGFPSVTEIIRPYIDTDWFLPEHAERGSAVHAACAAELGGLYVLPLPTEYQPYFDSFRRWLDFAKPEKIEIEKRLVDNKLGFCGQLDLSCLINKDVVVIDFKTSQAKYSWWKIQGAAYRHLHDQNNTLKTTRGGSLRLLKDGRTALFDPWGTNYQREFNIFLGLLNAHKFFKGGNHD